MRKAAGDLMFRVHRLGEVWSAGRSYATETSRIAVSTSLPFMGREDGDGQSDTGSSQPGYYEIQSLDAIPRGKRGLKRHRQAGYLPAILFSLPGETNQPILLQTKAINRLVNEYGPYGFQSRLFNLRLKTDESSEAVAYPVLAKNIHRTATTFDLENVTLMYCPPDRLTKVNVPIKLAGEDISPGVRKGCFISLTKRFIKCQASGSCIPSHFEVDVSQMDIAQKYYLDVLGELPTGVTIREKHWNEPICRMVGKAKAAAA